MIAGFAGHPKVPVSFYLLPPSTIKFPVRKVIELGWGEGRERGSSNITDRLKKFKLIQVGRKKEKRRSNPI